MGERRATDEEILENETIGLSPVFEGKTPAELSEDVSKRWRMYTNELTKEVLTKVKKYMSDQSESSSEVSEEEPDSDATTDVQGSQCGNEQRVNHQVVEDEEPCSNLDVESVEEEEKAEENVNNATLPTASQLMNEELTNTMIAAAVDEEKKQQRTRYNGAGTFDIDDENNEFLKRLRAKAKMSDAMEENCLDDEYWGPFVGKWQRNGVLDHLDNWVLNRKDLEPLIENMSAAAAIITEKFPPDLAKLLIPYTAMYACQFGAPVKVHSINNTIANNRYEVITNPETNRVEYKRAIMIPVKKSSSQ